MRRAFTCSRCAETATRSHRSNSGICLRCMTTHVKYQGHAIAVVASAIRRGEIPRASALACVDCGKPARDYDHRDYSKPLAVEPTCRSCNLKRGPALWGDLSAPSIPTTEAA